MQFLASARGILGLLAVASLFALAGCASKPRTAQEDSKIKSVAIVSAMDEQIKVRKLGVTVFGNIQQSVNMNGLLKSTASDVLNERFRTSRPAWVVKAAEHDSAALAAKLSGPTLSLTTLTGRISNELRAIAASADVDALFVVIDDAPGNYPGRGVGVVARDDQATLHTYVHLLLVLRNGEEIYLDGGGNRAVPLQSLGISPDLATLKDPNVQARVSSVLAGELRTRLQAITRKYGY